MGKEYNIISATVAFSLALHACSPFENPKSVKAAPLPLTTTLSQATPKIENIIPTPYETTTVTPDVPIAENCIMPFEGASANGGLQFLSPILNKDGKQDRDEKGRPYKHLGLDFKGNGSTSGEEILNICDGVFVFSGYVGNEYQSHRNMKTLGNVVVIKYRYFEGDTKKSLYMVYAHMRNIVTDMNEGEIIPRGTKIGEVSNSGGWLFPHLHINAWTDEAWNFLLDERFDGDMRLMAGFYPDSEYDDGQVRRDMVDPKSWLEERLGP